MARRSAHALAAGLLLALLALAAPGRAQDAPDYEQWEAVASRAESALDTSSTPDSSLELLRTQLAAQREVFLEAQDTHAARIEALEAQIEALGPVPESGEEPAETAERRAELEERLARLRQPRQAAEDAFFRAAGLIAEIDGSLRERRVRALLEPGPIPLNPALWPPALDALAEAGRALVAEPRAAWDEAARRDGFAARAAAAVVLALVGAALVVRTRGAMRPLMRRAEARLPPRAQGAAVFALSMGQVVLPVLGVVLITVAMNVSGLFGSAGRALAQGLALAALQYFAARWIGSWIFPVGERWNLTLGLPARARAEGRAYTALLGAALAVEGFLSPLDERFDWSVETETAVAFPLLVLVGLMLLRLGQLLVRHAGHAPPAEGETEPATAHGAPGPLLRNVGRAAVAVGAAGPVLAAVGYGRAAEALLGPAVLSLGLLGLLIILQQVIRDLYALASGRDDGARDALLPVLIGLALALASLPLFALIWGARGSDLTEVWARVRQGVRLGGTVVSPGAVAVFALILTVGYLLTRLVQGALRTQVLPRTRLDQGGRTAIVSGVGYVGFILAALVAITGAGIDLSSLAIVAGALSVGIGFGLQNVVNNFVSGIILLIERPISEGDWIQVGTQQGYVRRISVRSTRIETFDRTDVIVPNADLISGTVTNWTHGNLIGRLIIPVGVAYGTDTRLVERTLREVAEAHPMVLLRPPPSILFRRFGPDALEFEIRAILRDVNFVLTIETDLNHEIARRFQEEGIEIPYAQRDIWLRNPEALRAVVDAPEARAEEPSAEAGAAVVEPWPRRRDDAARGEARSPRP